MKRTKTLTRRGMVKRLALKLFLVAVLLVASVTAYAEIYYIPDDNTSGGPTFLSCGSSAGNYIAVCPDPDEGCSNCPCTICQDADCQEEANRQCAARGHGSGSESGYGQLQP